MLGGYGSHRPGMDEQSPYPLLPPNGQLAIVRSPPDLGPSNWNNAAYFCDSRRIYENNWINSIYYCQINSPRCNRANLSAVSPTAIPEECNHSSASGQNPTILSTVSQLLCTSSHTPQHSCHLSLQLSHSPTLLPPLTPAPSLPNTHSALPLFNSPPLRPRILSTHTYPIQQILTFHKQTFISANQT